jgi:hypothetical protein
MHNKAILYCLLPTHTYCNCPIHTQPIYSLNFKHVCTIIEKIMHSKAPLCYVSPARTYYEAPSRIIPFITQFEHISHADSILLDMIYQEVKTGYSRASGGSLIQKC